MKIQRFVATDMREAITRVRSELGRDAVILSSRRVRGGIEVVCAIDFDEQAVRSLARDETPAASSAGHEAPVAQPTVTAGYGPSGLAEHAAAGAASGAVAGDDPTIVAVRRELESMRSVLQRELANFARSEYARRAPVKARTIQRLLRLGLGDALAGRVAGDVRSGEGDDAAWREALAHLGNRIPIAGASPLHAAGVVAVVGPTGAGKTTTAAKLAATAAARYGREAVALVALEDPGRPVQAPLLGFGQRLGVATCMASSPETLRQTLGSLAGRRLIVIDTPGLARGDARAEAQAQALDAVRGLRRYLVLAANTHYDDLRAAAETFAGNRAAGCILTKLDEAAVFGSALSAIIDEGLPLALTTAGQDLEAGVQRPSVHKLVSRAVQSARERGARMQRHARGRPEVPHVG